MSSFAPPVGAPGKRSSTNREDGGPAERPAQTLSYERRASAPVAERRAAAEKQLEKLPVDEVVVIEPEAVKVAPEA